MFLSGGNPRLLKNSFYIASLKEIMSETILILNMDSHFHGNDRHKQNRHCVYSHKTDEVCKRWLYFIKQAKPAVFMGMTDTNKTDTGYSHKTDEVCRCWLSSIKQAKPA
jgi:hypothetical protein